MAKTPGERYATAQAMADDLRRFLDDEPIHARRPTRMQLAKKWVQRHRAGAALLVVTALSGIGLAGGIAWHIRQLHAYAAEITLSEARERDPRSGGRAA